MPRPSFDPRWPITKLRGRPLITVLLVDDSNFQRVANRRLLERAGYKVISVSDGHEALQVATDESPDVILLDMLLQKMAGPDVLKALKINPKTATIPVIVLSSLAQRNEAKLMRDGAAGYYEKSRMNVDNGSGLLELIHTLLRESLA
jgi:CheY-like chemotaxis protein